MHTSPTSAMAERGNLSGEGLVRPVFGRSALVSDRLLADCGRICHPIEPRPRRRSPLARSRRRRGAAATTLEISRLNDASSKDNASSLPFSQAAQVRHLSFAEGAHLTAVIRPYNQLTLMRYWHIQP